MTAGEQVGAYLIEARSGEGGVGEVYRARDTRLDRAVVLQVSKAAFGDRYAREARAIAPPNHPQLCTRLDAGPNCLVMAYIEGTPLRGPLPVEKATRISDALNAGQRKGFAHGARPPF